MENISEFRELSEKEREALRKELRKFTALTMDGGSSLGLEDSEAGEGKE